MTLIDLLKKMYLMKDVIQGSFNPQSELFSYIESYQDKESILAFSRYFRSLLTRTHPIFDRDANNRLTTRFALYLEAFMKLTQGNLMPMLTYLEKHKDVTLFLCSNWGILEKLYYEYKGLGKDIILLEEYSLLLDEDYKVIRVELKNGIERNSEPIKKEFLYGFFQKIRDNKEVFFGKNQQEREEFIEVMGTFFSSFHI
ncbi:hypothetical protein [Legionella bozemanae]|uniref:Uncharacterized protein n=1 Tax=Legionella bozemanae TaxID=447 RepID=A0A0W0RSF5_LEGBO|nr:hypothetical protein [Legionella bozemanae]KTC74001.1 hypothetical protein Lboz_1441 [Legionella bozemanae]STO33588.1 Uncharacterised protein [Legionella bozemanae]